MARTGRSSEQPGHISNIIQDLAMGDEVRIVINRPPNGVKDALVGGRSYTKEVVVTGRARGGFETFDRWSVVEISVEMIEGQHQFSIMTLVPSKDNRVVYNMKRGERNLYTIQYIEVIG